MTGPPISPELLQSRRSQLLRQTEQTLLSVRAAGRENLLPAEAAQYRSAVEELRSIDAEISRVSQINQTLASYGFAGGDTTPAPQESTMRTAALVRDDHLQYARGNNKVSWVKDFCKVQTGLDDGEARSRLNRHADEVKNDPAFTELRAISRVDGQGGYAVPPYWAVQDYIELARPGRAFANAVKRLPLPGGTDQICIPKLLTGTAVGVQPADNTAVTDVDLTDTYISAPVRTISGQEVVSIQLLDQSPISFDEVVFQDLISAHAAVTDTQVMSGTGTSGQVLGVDLTPGISTISASAMDIQGFYNAIANAIQLVHTTRFLPPEAIIMHPRRWGWCLSLLDANSRPLFIPNANGPVNVGGLLTEVASQQIVGSVAGLPVITDPNVTTSNGPESPAGTEDIVYVARLSDLYLYESGIRARVLPEVQSATLSVVLQVFSYIAFTAARFPQSVVIIDGLTAPTF